MQIVFPPQYIFIGEYTVTDIVWLKCCATLNMTHVLDEKIKVKEWPSDWNIV